jgi:hypothetical protein
MTKFTDNLWRDLAREHGPALALADRPEPGRARRLRHPSVLAGSTLALAGVGAAIALVLTSTSSTPASAAVTVAKVSDGSILVTLNKPGSQALAQADQKLAAMGLHEGIVIDMGSGPAAASGPVTCTPEPGIPNQPTVKVLVGTNGTEVINPGTTPGNTGVGTWHLKSCNLASDTGGTGNTGAG